MEELSTRVYYYEFDTSSICIFKKNELYTVKYLQHVDHNNKIKSRYHFKIISDTSNEYVKTIIMNVYTDLNPKPENIYRIYSSDSIVKTVNFKYDKWYTGNGSFSIKNIHNKNDKYDKNVIFKNIDNEVGIPTVIENIIFYYDEEQTLWIGTRDIKVYKIEISYD